MKPRFTSKDFCFLKPESDDHPVTPPETFFSDFIHSRPDPFVGFAQRIQDTRFPDKPFVCAVIQISFSESEPIRERARDTFESCFHSVLDNRRGIWESLTPEAFVLIFWDYRTQKKAIQLLESLKEKISSALNTGLLSGVAFHPFLDFTRNQIFEAALKARDHAAFFGPGHTIHFDAVTLNISGDRFYQNYRYQEAMVEYRTGLTLDPKNINMLNSLGVCHGVMGDLDLARTTFETALAINPKEIMVLYNLGLIHQISGDETQAIFFMKKAHGITNRIFEVELLLGHLLFKTGKARYALPHLEAATQLNPGASPAYRIMGEAFLQLDDPMKAGQAFNSAVKCNPSDGTALSGYALAMALQRKNLRIARLFAEKSLSLEPDNPVFIQRFEQVIQLSGASDSQEKTMKTA